MALTDPSHPTDIAMLTDLYELTMAQGLWEHGKHDERDCFTAFYRDHPFGSAYAVMCGTAELADLVENTRFTYEDIDYLASGSRPPRAAACSPRRSSSTCAASRPTWTSTPSPRASSCSRASRSCA